MVALPFNLFLSINTLRVSQSRRSSKEMVSHVAGPDQLVEAKGAA